MRLSAVIAVYSGRPYKHIILLINHPFCSVGPCLCQIRRNYRCHPPQYNKHVTQCTLYSVHVTRIRLIDFWMIVSMLINAINFRACDGNRFNILLCNNNNNLSDLWICKAYFSGYFFSVFSGWLGLSKIFSGITAYALHSSMFLCRPCKNSPLQ